MTDPRPLELERLRHVPGELLRSGDLRDQQAITAHLRWWHNRALHDAVGVAFGLRARLADDQRVVTVEPGVAHDWFGRPLLLRRPQDVSVPPAVTGPLVLLARAREATPPPPGGVARQAVGQLELLWRPAGSVGPRDGVPLARIQPGPGGLEQVPCRTQRARPLARPHLGYGATPEDGTAWRPWSPIGDQLPLGIEVEVDTSAAGFTDVPCYFAWLRSPGLATAVVRAKVYADLSLQYVEEPAHDRFVFRVVLAQEAAYLARPSLEGQRQYDPVSQALELRLSVCWLGVQDDRTPVRGPSDEGSGNGHPG